MVPVDQLLAGLSRRHWGHISASFLVIVSAVHVPSVKPKESVSDHGDAWNTNLLERMFSDAHSNGAEANRSSAMENSDRNHIRALALQSESVGTLGSDRSVLQAFLQHKMNVCECIGGIGYGNSCTTAGRDGRRWCYVKPGCLDAQKGSEGLSWSTRACTSGGPSRGGIGGGRNSHSESDSDNSDHSGKSNQSAFCHSSGLCRCIGGPGYGNNCTLQVDTNHRQFSWCYVKVGCPLAQSSMHRDLFWSEEPCRCHGSQQQRQQ
eukprot:TRINITY_DN43390_c0_g1_i1.p1 TRINITY_DN43390_c0_g1~~TRINITY_DN43390_c0_g1_i1.p1  ORF type:complete len:263 (-),score=23.94 TRINITY_DN43390_c0_g1_i1:59-847(-)